MAEVVISYKLVEEVGGSLLTWVKKEINYMWKYEESIEKLKSEVEELKNKKERVEQKIKLALHKGDELVAGVEKWVNDALNHISTTDEFLKKEDDAKKTCFNLPMCVNLITLRHYSKEATNKVPSLKKHQRDGVAYEGDISIPTASPGILELYPRENFDELSTHKSVLEKIIESVKDESIQITGIWGIGGVGKTTLATEVAARVKDLFDLVVFVTVSQRVDATKIKEEVDDAAKRIVKGDKILIILDDVWTEVKLHTVGIPCGTRHPSCKILLTSRLSSVCTSMDVGTPICVECLPMEEAWVLFKRVVGERVETDAKLKQVARKVVEGCGGLPLILQAVGKALKGEQNFKEWERALDNIAKDETSDIGRALRVEFARLKLSYDHLESEQVKLIFLLCSMFPEDFNVSLERLAYYGVGLQVCKNLSSLEDARNKVQGAVKILKSYCLLLNGCDESTTKMHDVVREVALLIASKDKNSYLVEAGKNLTEWEPRIGSLESYTGISLMNNDICKLPEDYELKIPLLDIFLIQQNHNLSEISDEFILAVKEAKVIDFEYNNIISVPKSFNQLTRLRMLNLGGNKLFCDVSILGELKDLEILILNDTGIKEIPQEIGNLVKLRLFHAARCRGLSHIEPGVLSKLRWLEELHIGYYPVEEGKVNSLAEIGKLSKLTFLNLHVPHICLFPEGDYLKRLKRFFIQRCYNILCLVDSRVLDEMRTFHPSETHQGMKENTRFLSKMEQLRLFDLSNLNVIWNCPDQYISLRNLVTCEIGDCHKLEKLFTVSVAQGLVKLQKLTIRECRRLKEVISDGDEETSTGDSDTAVPAKKIEFPLLSEIHLRRMMNLKSFYPRNATIKYPSLVKVEIYRCNALEKWGYGTHDTPILQWVNNTKANGSTIDETLVLDREARSKINLNL